MAASLLKHETIRTTVPKAKALRRVVEPLITLPKVDTEAKRRTAFSRLRDAAIVTKLFTDLLALLARFDLTIDPQLAGMFRALATLEGTLRLLTADFDLIGEAKKAATDLAAAHRSEPQS